MSLSELGAARMQEEQVSKFVLIFVVFNRLASHQKSHMSFTLFWLTVCHITKIYKCSVWLNWCLYLPLFPFLSYSRGPDVRMCATGKPLVVESTTEVVKKVHYTVSWWRSGSYLLLMAGQYFKELIQFTWEVGNWRWWQIQFSWKLSQILR